ncbi:DNA protecting protein DprA [Parvibaculum lavamentivorans DS-1]|uniref:DNA protecting protein DprA n=1 Tax=Parvibaculum lavamentivorans (strain DS-1 / DSM 13023 / NCIMB 13966) TaxID=402881 RepID=A7HX07_PARL1|nr:DNA-processing protein DprA [Parvibaculum lavamentivorans]ABS64440.1 DNA protecting protein DprA [Parvibaculum lavamentivorans DS-1]
MTSPLSPAERLARLRLARSENVGPVTFRDLLEHFGNALAALDALPDLASRGGARRSIKIASAADAEAELAKTEKTGARILVLGDEDFPPRLAAVDPPPPVISVAGDVALLARKSIAIVGSRNASAAGRRIAATMAETLGAEGYAVVSGLARGIDTSAHRASLASGTIAVLAGGLDIVYPEENRELQTAIASQGALVSEMPPGTSPQARHFPRRNRLISGLSLAVVVVEAALRSGSLITARFALEQGRDVFAVPGSPLDPRAQGANRLIKDGAPLVENAQDVIAALAEPLGRRFGEPDPPSYAPRDASAIAADSDARTRILSALGPTPTPLDEIVRQASASVPLVRAVLLELELAGRLHRDPGDRVSLLPEEA